MQSGKKEPCNNLIDFILHRVDGEGQIIQSGLKVLIFQQAPCS